MRMNGRTRCQLVVHRMTNFARLSRWPAAQVSGSPGMRCYVPDLAFRDWSPADPWLSAAGSCASFLDLAR